MQISNNTSPAFGSIQAGITRMDNYQKKVCDTFFRGIKYSEKYSKYAEEDIDVYVLPSKTADIEVRYMDPYSGKFFRDGEGKIIKQPLLYITREGFWRFTDNVIDTLKKITEGAIKRPKPNIHKVIMADTEMAKLNPYKADDELYNLAQDLVKEGLTQKDAEKIIYQEYVNSYHIGNKDADF